MTCSTRIITLMYDGLPTSMFEGVKITKFEKYLSHDCNNQFQKFPFSLYTDLGVLTRYGIH